MYKSQDLSKYVCCTVDVYTISKDSAMPIKMSKTWMVCFSLAKTEKRVCPLGPHQVKS